MSCLLLSSCDYNNLAEALIAIAYDHQIVEGYRLRNQLKQLCRTEDLRDGARNFVRLCYVANYRAYRNRYKPSVTECTFTSIKSELSRPRPHPYHIQCDTQLLIQVCKFLQCVLYQCLEDGPKVSAESRKMWSQFTDMQRIVTDLVIANLPEYNQAIWSELPVTWKKRY